MKLAAVTYGTEGDTRPIATLCRALIDAGDEAFLLADGGTLQPARDLGVPHAALAGDIRQAIGSAGRTTQGRAMQGRKSPGLDATAQTLAGLARGNAKTWIHQILDASSDCDGLIVAGLAAYAGFAASEKSGVPVIAASMIPLTPTAAFPSPFLPPRPMPRWLNRPSYRLLSEALWRAFRESSDSARASVGLPPGKRPSADYPMIYGISPTLLPRPADWPPDAWLCGQWVRPVPEWTPPAPLADFLAAGGPPVYVGFGSMSALDHDALLAAVITAVGGRRAVFYPGWSAAETPDLPDNFFVLGNTPHDWLFPRTSMIIHHGGSGTTHSAARAGVPSIVLPFAADQFFWARQLQRLGIAPAISGARRVTAAELSTAITAAGSTSLRERAAEVGARMGSEDGPATAVDKIHTVLAAT